MNRLFLFLLALVAATPFLTAQTADPAKLADYQKRFRQGVELAGEGKPAEALKIFDSIIAEEPKARGSLFYAGFVSSQMGEYAKAADYLKKFRDLEPKDFKGLILSIQVSQALKRTAAVESLRRELYDVRKGTNTPGLSDAQMYVREKVIGDKGTLSVISEFFDYQKEPYRLWQVEQLDTDGNVGRHLVLSYSPEDTKKLREKDPRAEMFFLGEYVIREGKIAQVNIYRQEFAKPSYEQCRDWMLSALKTPPKPLAISPLAPPSPSQ
jgi:tetratricopeptide (TPR) repeat protein